MVERFTLYPTFQTISNWGGVNIFSALHSSKRKKIHLLLVIVLIIVHPIALVLWKPKIYVVVASLYRASFVTVGVSNLICNIYINFSQNDKLKKLLKCLAILDFNLKRLSGDSILKEDMQFYVYLTMSLVSLLGTICLDTTYKMIKYDSIALLRPLMATFTSYYLQYLLMLKIFQFACIVFTIKTTLTFLNENIRKVFTKSWKMDAVHVHKRERLKSLMKCYDVVFEMVALCNKIFGVLILAVYPYLLIYFLRIITICIKSRLLTKNGLTSFNVLLFVSDILGCLFCVVSTKKTQKINTSNGYF